MHHLIFCRDGVLRRSFVSRDRAAGLLVSRLLPLQAWEASVEPRALLASLNTPIAFEEGLTVLELMENLAPWADIMTGVASMDFPAFLAEARQSVGPGHARLEKIALRYRVVVGAQPKYDRKPARKRKEEGSLPYEIGKPAVSGRLKVEAGWVCDALLKTELRSQYDGCESLSLSLSPMSEWAQLPVVIEDDGWLLDETATNSAQGFLGSNLSITRMDHPLVVDGGDEDGRGRLPRFPLSSPIPSFYEALVMGLFREAGFSYSPVQRERTVETIRQRVEDFDKAPAVPQGKQEGAEAQGLVSASLAVEYAEQDRRAGVEQQLLEQVMRASETLGLEVRTRDRPIGQDANWLD